MAKYLITGATGFIGTYFMKYICENNDEAYIIVRSNHEHSEICPNNNITQISLDLDNITELHNFIKIEDIDCCVHFAWEGSTGNMRGDYSIQLENIRRTLDLCEELARFNVKRFVGIGSLAEKDTSYYVSLDGSEPNIAANYGLAKTAANHMSKVVCNRLGIEHIWCTLSNVYGVGDKSNNFVNYASILMLQGQHAAFTKGEHMYDFVYVSDAAKGIYYASKYGRTNTSYFVGSGRPRKLKKYIYAIRDAVNPQIELYLGEIPFNGVCLPDKEFETGKLEKDTGYKSEVYFEQGINMTIQWLKMCMVNTD